MTVTEDPIAAQGNGWNTVAVQFKAWVEGRSLTGIAGSKPPRIHGA